MGASSKWDALALPLHTTILPLTACRMEREEQSAKGPLEALADAVKGAAGYVK